MHPMGVSKSISAYGMRVGESQMVGLQYSTTPENWRRIAHLVSDSI